MAIKLSSNDVIIIGAPGVLSVWGFDLVRTVARQLSDVKLASIDWTDEVEEVPPDPQELRTFYLSQYPSPSLGRLVRSERLPVVAFIDDPVDAVRYMREMLSCNFIEAIRAQTAAATVYTQLRDNRSVALFDRSSAGSAGVIAARLLEQLRLGLDTTAEKRLPEKFSFPLEAALSRHVAGYAPLGRIGSLSAEEAAIVEQVLRPMLSMASSQNIDPICWPSSVFLFGDQPDKHAPPKADLTGPARVIFYGPYFHLPAGRWRVRMVISFSDDPLGMPFSVEVHGSALIAKAIIQPKGEGTFQVTFSMNHERPQDALELRIRNEEGAIEGKVSLSHVQLIPE